MRPSNSGNPIYVLGQELLLEFAQFLETCISSFLLKRWGEDWFNQCAVKDGRPQLEDMRDLSFLLRQILDLNNHNFRAAIGISVFGEAQMQKPHLLALEQIRKSRNFLAHPNRIVKLYDLSRLAFNIQAIVPASTPLASKCASILTTNEKSEHLTKIASLTEINRKYRNSAEYRSEVARSIKVFTDRIADFNSKSEDNYMFIAQNHLLRSLWWNWLILQPLHYTLLWDSLLEKRNPRTGARLLSDSQLEELSRELDTAGGFQLAEEFLRELYEDTDLANCKCEFCRIVGNGPISFKEKAHQKIEEVLLAIETGGDIKKLFDNKEPRGMWPFHYMLIGITCASKGNIPVDKIMDEWHFDLINPILDLNSESFENHDVLIAAIKLIAIRNGIPPLEVEKWNLE